MECAKRYEGLLNFFESNKLFFPRLNHPLCLFKLHVAFELAAGTVLCDSAGCRHLHNQNSATKHRLVHCFRFVGCVAPRSYVATRYCRLPTLLALFYQLNAHCRAITLMVLFTSSKKVAIMCLLRNIRV